MFSDLRILGLALFIALVQAACGGGDAKQNSADDAGPGDDAGSVGDASGTPSLKDEYVLSSADSVPEGVAFDAQERAFYASSLNGGSITKVEADGRESTFHAADGAALSGLKIDVMRRRLWVCAADALWVFDLKDSKRSHTFPLAAATEGAGCNDVALDAKGRAYATDSRLPNIYTASVDDGAATLYATDPRFKADLLGLNGIVVSEDGAALFVGMYLAGKLFRVSLTDAADIAEVALTGTAFSSPDGLVLLDGTLYAISDGEVKKVTLTGDKNLSGKVTVQAYSDGGLSTGVAAEGALYAIKSETVAFVLTQTLKPPFKIVRIDLNAFK